MELEKIIKGDEELLDYVQKSIDGLEDLYKLLSKEKSIWNHVLGSNPPLKDIQNTYDELRDAYGADSKKLQKAESEQTKIKDRMPSGPNIAGKANKHSRKLIYIGGIVLVLLILFVIVGI
jgi:hypothetical protein